MMRIYEIARQYKKSSKDIIALLKKKGFDPKSHMAVLSDKELAIIKTVYQGTKKVQQTAQANKASSSKKNRVITSHSIKRVKTKDKQEQALKKKLKIVAKAMSVGQAAKELGLSASEVILALLSWGIVSAKNQTIQADVVDRLANHFGIPVVQPELYTEKNVEIVVDTAKLVDRLPVIAVLGHVDHGKTSFLDFVRKTRVAEREKGGITQHLGAYEAQTSQGNLIFIDTPGHEAFSKMRQRGARLADFAILIVAADDGIMPQTIEAIKYIKAEKTPVIVAINKMDKSGPERVEIVKRQLSQHDLLSEDWGGDVVCLPISAKTGKGIEELLEMIVLQTQLLELRAEGEGPGKGYILESKLEKGRGAVATVISKHGRIAIGDHFVCGNVTGRVTSLIDSYGNSQKDVGPSVPVRVAGFDTLPAVGDFFEVVPKDVYRKAKMSREKVSKFSKLVSSAKENAIAFICKTDTHSSREALLDSIEKLSHKTPVPFSIITSGVGYITEGDIELAYTTGASIIGLHTKAEAKVLRLAQRRGVSIFLFDIIYKLLEYLEQLAESKKEKKIDYVKMGEAIVLRVFKIKGSGVIAGCRVTDGRFVKGAKVVVWRGEEKVGEGKIKSLQREKRTVKEVLSGFECGFTVEGLDDFLPDDRIESFDEIIS